MLLDRLTIESMYDAELHHEGGSYAMRLTSVGERDVVEMHFDGEEDAAKEWASIQPIMRR